jgi:hypothetical protein
MQRAKIKGREEALTAEILSGLVMSGNSKQDVLDYIDRHAN